MNKPVFLIMPSAAKISIRNLRKRGTVITKKYGIRLFGTVVQIKQCIN